MLRSTIYTIGTALTRAHDREVPVDVLVTGQWIHGNVSAVDGHGVVLQCDDGGIAMIRVENVSVVLVRQAEAFEGQQEAPRAEAHPMPAAAAPDQGDDNPRVVRPRPSIENIGLRRTELVRRISDDPSTFHAE
jgi:hypothetical protein